jgi:hypothetical protein
MLGVPQCTPNLPGIAQRLRMIALGKHRAPAGAEQQMEPLGQPDREPLHPPRECFAIARLDDEVQMVALHRELHYREALFVCELQAPPDPP